jgi:hypothetical protein
MRRALIAVGALLVALIVTPAPTMHRHGAYQPVAGYNPLDDIKGSRYFDCCTSQFFSSRSPEETAAIKRAIDQEEADKRILSAAGLFGVLAALLARTLDPFVWFVAFILFGIGVAATERA